MKLGKFAILMIGIMVFVATTSWGFFYSYMPNVKEVGMLNDNRAANEAEAAKLPKAKARYEKAKQMIDVKAAEWNKYVETRTPPMSLKDGGIDLAVNPWQLSVDTPKFRDSVQKAVNAQLKKGGVKVISSPLVPRLDANMPVSQILSSFFNYPAIKFPVVIFDFGTITVEGTYQQILANVRSYKTMPNYLAVTDALRIDGTSPVLTGTYNLTVVGFIRTKTIAPNVPEGGAEAASSPLGGAFGGPPAGFGGPGAGAGRRGGALPGGVGGPAGGRGTPKGGAAAD